MCIPLCRIVCCAVDLHVISCLTTKQSSGRKESCTRRQTPSENGRVNKMSSHDIMVNMIPQQLLLSARNTGPPANTYISIPHCTPQCNYNCLKYAL